MKTGQTNFTDEFGGMKYWKKNQILTVKEIDLGKDMTF